MRPNGAPMTFIPCGIGDAGFLDRLQIAAFDVDRNGEPQETLRRLDAVAVPPVPLRELGVVEQDEFIDVPNEIEVAFPRYVAGLDDRDGLRHAGGGAGVLAIAKPVGDRISSIA